MMQSAATYCLAKLDQLHNFAALSHRRAVMVLALVGLALFLPGFFNLQPMDRDEPRFAQASKQMLETGDYVRIRFQQQARNKKPAGVYWLQTTSVAAGQLLGIEDARRTIWLYRLPSLLGALAALLLTYWTALAFMARWPAFLAALLFGSTLLIGVEAHLAKTDAVLLVTILAAMGALARLYQGQGPPDDWRLPAIFWSAIGIGLLIKGPVTPMVPLFAGLALVIVDRGAPWFKRLRFFPGLVWALLIALPWFVLIMIETKGGFLIDSLGKDMLAKVGSGKEGHGAPPLTYFAAFWVTAWPMAPLAALAAPFVWKNRRHGPVLFLLAWLVPVWLVFELVPTKLPHYVLPTYPAIALLTVLALDQLVVEQAGRWRKWIAWLLPAIPLIVVLAGAGLAIYTRAWPGWWWFVFGPTAILVALLAIGPSMTPAQRILTAGLAAICLYVATYSGILVSGPGRVIAVSPKLAAWAKLAGQERCGNPALASAGYYEPSLVFLTRTDILMTNGAGAAKHLADGRCRLAFVDIRQEGTFKPAITGIPDIRLLGRVAGINLNGGKPLDIGVWLRQ